VSVREDEYVKHVFDSVENGIVEEALKHECDGDGIIFKTLDEIRDRFPDADWYPQ
jgi:putative transposase